MRKLLLTASLSLLLFVAYGQRSYWQQEVNFTIDVSLNDRQRTLDAFETIEYVNHSPDTLQFIWFHVWPNAYKNDRTAFSDQMIENGDTRFYFSDDEEKGYLNRLDFKVNNQTAATEDHPQYIDVIKLVLPSPLAPGGNITITTPFHVKLPFNFSRGGYDGESFQITQWYPKPAVYDAAGWHPMPYLDQGEFYSEFGKYDVTITIPSNFVVAATGQLQDEPEQQWLAGRNNFSWQPVKKTVKVKGVNKLVRQDYPTTAATRKTIRFHQDNIHDFAWFADKRFQVQQDSCRLASGKIITAQVFRTNENKDSWAHAMENTKAALRFYSSLVGDYPYSTMSVVQGPISFGGGMEYPGITVITAGLDAKELDLTIAHEIGHNWFYGALASNERDHPWMDEGVNSYYEELYATSRYGPQPQLQRISFETTAIEKKDQPIRTGAADFNTKNYNLAAYYKTAAWLHYLQQEMGTGAFNNAMQSYYQEWKFKHPRPADFQQSMQQASTVPLDSTFSLLDKKGLIPGMERSGFQFLFLPDIHSIDRALKQPKKNTLVLTPALGGNSYDHLMVGGLISNMSLPLPQLQFLLAPMYATGSKKLAGLGFVNYNFFPNKIFQKIDIGVSGSLFSRDKFEDSSGTSFLPFHKIVPRARFTFKEKDPRATRLRYIQFKSYFIQEGNLSFRNDSLISPTDTIVTQRHFSKTEDRVLNQLLLVWENYRALYPWRGELKAEQARGFVRLAFTGNYFLNYSSNKGGVDVRVFAGKFIYTNKSKANPYLYGLNLSAPKGNLDYTYSDYFVGRNDYPFRADGVKWTIPYQQVMIRDGGLKVNTDAQGNIGASDDWLAALNFTFDLPDNINPLTLLPVKIPLKVFADIGTYAQPWQHDASGDRFLYDAGFQVSLVKDLVNIYVPLVYSPVFKDYYRSILEKKGRFFKTISFSIDISKFNTKRFTKDLPF